MFIRWLFLIDILFILIEVNNGYVRTYADEYYGRIRGSSENKGLDGGLIFLIIFACLVGGFFVICILSTLILGFFDHGFHCPVRLLFNRNNSSMNSYL